MPSTCQHDDHQQCCADAARRIRELGIHTQIMSTFQDGRIKDTQASCCHSLNEANRRINQANQEISQLQEQNRVCMRKIDQLEQRVDSHGRVLTRLTTKFEKFAKKAKNLFSRKSSSRGSIAASSDSEVEDSQPNTFANNASAFSQPSTPILPPVVAAASALSTPISAVALDTAFDTASHLNHSVPSHSPPPYNTPSRPPQTTRSRYQPLCREGAFYVTPRLEGFVTGPGPIIAPPAPAGPTSTHQQSPSSVDPTSLQSGSSTWKRSRGDQGSNNESGSYATSSSASSDSSSYSSYSASFTSSGSSSSQPSSSYSESACIPVPAVPSKRRKVAEGKLKTVRAPTPGPRVKGK